MYVSEHGEANKAGACGFTWHRVHNLVPLHEHMQLAWIYGSSRNICGSYSEPLKQRKRHHHSEVTFAYPKNMDVESMFPSWLVTHPCINQSPQSVYPPTMQST